LAKKTRSARPEIVSLQKKFCARQNKRSTRDAEIQTYQALMRIFLLLSETHAKALVISTAKQSTCVS
jgi:hypothetical protein